MCEHTRRDVLDRLEARGYVSGDARAVVTHPLTSRPSPPVLDESPGTVVEIVEQGGVEAWVQASAVGWGHTTDAALAANRAYGEAAAVADRPGLLLARSSVDGRVVGCAALRITDGIATLGGMSTLPDERRRGVQAVLIAHRLELAVEAGCSLATSMAMPGGDSARNLLRCGFVPSHTRTTWERAAG